MATVTRPSDSLPDPGDALKAEPIRDHINNILTFLESNNIDSANVDYSSADGIMVLNQSQTVTGAKNFSNSITLSGSAVVDLNGIADSLVLDADADTTISSPTDDQIDIEVGGADLYKFTATAFVSGSNIVSDTTNTDSLGTTALTWSDLYLGDSSVLAFGEDQDVTLTHDPDDGIFLNAGMKLAFRDMGGEYIYSVADGTLGIVAATEVDITTTTLDVNGAVDISGATAIGGTLNVGASTAIANVKDEDNMASNSATSLSTQQSIKAYVDSQVAGADTLTELTDTNITSAADASMLLYDTGTSRWIDNVMSGDATMADTGAVTFAGTNTNLTTLANVTTVGTIGTGTWQGTKVASAYLDDQTAHLNGTQSFTGAKTFGAASQFNSTITVGADDAGYDVIFYGNTASANATWDTSADDLILSGAAGLVVPEGQLTLGSTAVSSTAAEINLIDGGTARGTTSVASGDGLLVNDAGTMRMTNVDTVSTYFASHNVGGTNIATVGTIGTGAWESSTVVASAYLDAQTAHLNVTQSFTGAKTFGAASQFNSTITVGANDAGHDVILYGNAASANVTWDTSVDDLIFNGAARLIVPNGQLVVGSVALTSTASELNLLDALDRGSIIYGNASGATTVLGQGADGTVLTSDGDDISWEAAASSGHTIQEEGSGLTARANLNFVGAGVTATDDSGNNATKVTVAASGALLPFTNSNGGSDAIALSSAAIGESLVTDTSPQLGGNLDVNGQSIVSDSGNENIPITPHGTGSVVISKLSVTGDTSLDGGSFVFNESGADKDFRIEGDTQANLFVADASTDRIGIGTAAPTDPLTLSYTATDYATGLVVHNTNTAGYGATIRFETEYGGGTDKHAAISAAAEGAAGGGSLDFYTGSDATTLNRAMRINNAGKVGIGTAGPTTALNVVAGSAIFRVAHTGNAYATQLGYDGLLNVIDDSDSNDFRVAFDGSVKLTVEADTGSLTTVANSASWYAGVFTNDGNSANRHGIQIQCGADNASGQTPYINCLDGDGGQIGYIWNNNGTFQLVDGSDERGKEDIVDTTVDGLATINAISVKDFTRKKSGERVSAGFTAQQMQTAYLPAVSQPDDVPEVLYEEDVAAVLYEEGDDLPEGKSVGDVKTEAIKEGDVETEGYTPHMGVAKDTLIGPLVKAVQQLSAKVTALESA